MSETTAFFILLALIVLLLPLLIRTGLVKPADNVHRTAFWILISTAIGLSLVVAVFS